jgi:hypothetical protein
VTQFSSVFVKPTHRNSDTINDGQNMGNTPIEASYGTMDEFLVDESLVLKELSKLPEKATRSTDNIPPVLLKKCAHQLVGPITHILRLSLTNGKIPNAWRHILVRPTHKKGCKKKVSNYRPIGLTSIISKICERLVRDQLVRHLSKQGSRSERQHGFRERRSTITSLLQAQSEWKDMLTKHTELFVIYLDFSKAFDVVDHGILKAKLFKAGLRGRAIGWLVDYLSRRTMSVIWGDFESAPHDVHSGVIQGSALGPALFSSLADDIPSVVGDSASTNLFADDVKLCNWSLSLVEEASSKVVVWSQDNKLPLAPDKSILFKVRKKRVAKDPVQCTVNGVTLNSVPVVRDLGIMINDDLCCTEQISEMQIKSFRLSNLILRILKTKKLDLFKKAFHSLILPTLEYGSVIWNPNYVKDVNSIEIVLRRFTKRAQAKCGYPSESYQNRLKRWGMHTLEYRRLGIDLTWVYKIVYGYIDLDRNLFFRLIQTESDLKIYPLPLASKDKNDTQMNTLASRTYKVWNNLPIAVRLSPSINSFKANLKSINMTDMYISKIIL